MLRNVVSLRHILNVLEGDPFKEPPDYYQELTAADLCQQVEGLSMKQATRLIISTIEMIASERGVFPTLGQAIEKLSLVESHSKVLLKGVELLLESKDVRASRKESKDLTASQDGHLSPRTPKKSEGSSVMPVTEITAVAQSNYNMTPDVPREQNYSHGPTVPPFNGALDGTYPYPLTPCCVSVATATERQPEYKAQHQYNTVLQVEAIENLPGSSLDSPQMLEDIRIRRSLNLVSNSPVAEAVENMQQRVIHLESQSAEMVRMEAKIDGIEAKIDDIVKILPIISKMDAKIDSQEHAMSLRA